MLMMPSETRLETLFNHLYLGEYNQNSYKTLIINRFMPIFVVQFHRATHDHYDFRLESGGVLKSWAVPKMPPLAKGLKRLEIEVPDHPKSYASFEGEIKEGYGKGLVKIWDNGNYKLILKSSTKIEFELQGKRMKGKYVLLKTEFGKNPKTSWLLMKTG